MAKSLYFGPGDPNVPGGGGMLDPGGSLGIGGFAPGPGLGSPQNPSPETGPLSGGITVSIGGIPIVIGGGGGGGGGTPGSNKPQQSTVGLNFSPGGGGGGGGGAIGQVTRGGTQGGQLPAAPGMPYMVDPLNFTPQPAVNFPQPRQTPEMFFLGNFQQGGIVPQTGLYPVRGGEQVIPRKKVQKIAKLHKGELVLPRYVGSFQDGTASIPSDGTPMTPVEIQQQQQNAELQRRRAVARAAGVPIDEPTIDPNAPTTRASGRPMSEQPPVNIPGVSTPGFNPLGILGKLFGRGQQAAGGMPAAGVVSPGIRGNLPGTTQVPQYGAQEQRPTLPTGGILPGTPPAVGVAGGPASYYVPPQQVPFQSQFVNKAARNQYITANLTGQLSNALMMWRQKKYDEKVQEVKNQTSSDLWNAYLRQQAAGQQQQQPQAQQQTPQQQPGQPQGVGAQPQGTVPQPQGTSGGGAPGQPGQPADPTSNWSANDRHAYQVLNQDPKTQKLAQQFLKSKQQEEVKRMKNYAEAETKPFGAAYTGKMQAYQDFQNQLNAQAELEVKQAQAQAQRTYAETAAQEQKMRTDFMQRAMSGQPGQGLQLGVGAQLGAGTPWYPAIQKMGPFTPDEEGVINGGIADWIMGDKTAMNGILKDVFNQREIVRRPKWLQLGNGTYQMFRFDPQANRDVPVGDPQANLPPGQTLAGAAPAEGALNGGTASEQTGAKPAGVPQVIGGLQAGPKVYKNINVYAFDPKAGRNGQWKLTTPQEADQKGWTNPTKEITPKEMSDDRQMDVRLNDTTKKLLRYEDSFKNDLSVKDKALLAGALSDDQLRVALLGVEIPTDWLTRLTKSTIYNGLSKDGQHRLFAYGNAKEAMLGYNRVLAGSARAIQQGLQLNIDVLPVPLISPDMASDGFGQFKENIPTISQGLPIIPGVDNPEDILSGKISWRSQTPGIGQPGAGGFTPPSPSPSAGGGGAQIIQTKPAGAVGTVLNKKDNNYYWYDQNRNILGRAPNR